MMGRTIRVRMLWAATLPVALVVVAVVAIFWWGAKSDLDGAHAVRVRLIARQVAQASEFGVFSGNRALLQGVVSGAMREPDVVAVAVYDSSGMVMASVGFPNESSVQAFAGQRVSLESQEQDVDSITQPMVGTTVPLNDLFESDARQTDAASGNPVGHVVVRVSRAGLMQREKTALLLALGVGLAGILCGAWIAIRMGRRVVQPILDVSLRIQRIGRGDFSPQPQATAFDPLHEMQESLEQMARRLALSRDDLRRQVDEVTHELRLQKEQAENATIAKTRFLAAASHDLRQPTHAIGLFAGRLGQLPLDANMRRVVDNLEASVRALQDLLDGLLDLSKLEAGAVQVQLAPVDLGQMLQAIRNDLEVQAADKGLRLRVRPSPYWALSDRPVLQRIVMNLTQNAIRYTQKGTVLVSSRPAERGNGIRIEVWDSGIGIAPEHHATIFTEFFQVGNTGRDRTQGMGLGLNIVQRSAQILGHTITLRSEVGCGTRFTVTVPRIEEPSGISAAQADPRLFAAYDFTGQTVLLLEDDDLARSAMVELLSSWGCQVLAASSLTLASTLLAAAPDVSVIVSDFRLGEADDGMGAIFKLRAQARRHVPACLVSGDLDGALMQMARDAGITLLHKPVRPAKMRSLLRHLFNDSSAVPEPRVH